MNIIKPIKNIIACSTIMIALPVMAQSNTEKQKKKKAPTKTIIAPVLKTPTGTVPRTTDKIPTLAIRPAVIGAPLPAGSGGTSSHEKKPAYSMPIIGAPLPAGSGGTSSHEKKPATGGSVIGAPLPAGSGGSSSQMKKPATDSLPIIGAPMPGSGTSSYANKPAEATVSSSGRETFKLSNGQQIPRTGPDGNTGIPDDKGGVSYTDGTYVTADEGGNTVVSHGGKVQSVTPPPGSGTGGAVPSHSSTGAATYTLSNGQQIPRFGPDGGSAGIADNKGGVSYADGTYVMVDEDGNTVVSRGGKVVSKTSAPDSQSDTGSSSGDSSSSSSDDGSSDSEDDDSSDDTSSDDDTDSDDTDDDADTDTDTDDDSGGEESADEYGIISNGTNNGPSQIVKDIVNRRIGIGRTPESSSPEDCKDQGGGHVMDPWGTEGSNCIPAGTPRPGDDKDSDTDGKKNTSGVIWQAPTKGAIRDAVSQPGLTDYSLGRDDGKAPLEVLQLFKDSVTNPAPE